ncbi:MAG: alpha/beta hydrolase [Fibrobacteres bacterium]|nr:alpha/beta hydrolase [Fibrobacterota bacterium]
MTGSSEEMFFFDGVGGKRLLGFFHPAAGPARRGGVVYCHPFAEEKNQSHAVIVRTARGLAAAGIPVLRFDFSGCGDSEGDLQDASAEDWVAEVGCAADWLRKRTGNARVGLWGLRAGANLAALYAAGRSDVAFAVLWQPLPDLKTCMTQFLRQKFSSELAAGNAEGFSVKGLVKRLEAGETLDVMGYPVTRRLYESFATKTPPLSACEFPFPLCLAAITEADAPPDALKRMAEGLRASNRPAPLQHAREVPFWDRYWRWEAPSLPQLTSGWIASVA